jgi:hypothetical protein
MNCRDVRDVADSLPGEELLTETNHEILWHLDTCPSCRTEMDARRRLRAALRGAFNYAPELQPVGDFADRLRDQLRQTAGHSHRSRMVPGRWLTLAAGVVLAAGVITAILINRPPAADDTLARDAIGDHRNCALKYRLVRMPMSLEEAAQQFDSAYRVLLTAPPDDVSTPNGPVHVVERHSCAFGTRRFGHVILQYRGRVVSLLMTANGGATGPAASADAVPHVIGRPLDGLSTVSLNGSRHAIVLVSDLGNAELTQLARTVSSPLVQRLEGVVHKPGRETAFMAARPLDALALPFVLTWNGSRE